MITAIVAMLMIFVTLIYIIINKTKRTIGLVLIIALLSLRLLSLILFQWFINSPINMETYNFISIFKTGSNCLIYTIIIGLSIYSMKLKTENKN